MKVLLAVSGGIDSMYMLHRAPELFPGASFAVAHCNFRLRGDESDGDEEFVVKQCRELGTECYVKRFDTVKYAKEQGISVEMAARELRYAWFAELRSKYGFDTLATAHNANDNAETLILNLLRGTGTKGLRGIPRSTREGIARPLLDTSREEISSWMLSEGKQWREDRTNAGNEARRNKIRNQVFPVFSEINPSYIKTIGADIRRFTQTDDIAEDYFMDAAPRIRCAGEDGSVEISVTALLSLKHWRYVLWRILEDCSFSAETFDKLCTLLDRYRTEPSGTVTLSGKVFESPAFLLYARRRKLVISKKQG
ncbi:MAG: tRNA lysidine(34) synthetase TilS [Bacteroidales bacterium]|nr:tRNA lysidine(34) synthetase TilS [Bacteroidales bacterium]